MIWWFFILAFSTGAVLWVGMAFYLRVRRHLKEEAAREATAEREPD